MKKSIARKLIKALESGEYCKGSGRLVTRGNHGDSFCCLGVLCDIAARSVSDWTPDGKEVESYNDGYPRAKVYAWSGMTQSDALGLAILNDRSTSFGPVIEKIKQIAGLE